MSKVSIGAIVTGALVLAVGVASVILRIIGWPVSSWYGNLTLIAAGGYLVVFGIITQVASEWYKTPLILIGGWVSVWSFGVTRLVAFLYGLYDGSWDPILAVALTQMPIIAIVVELWYGNLVRKILIEALKRKYSWNTHKTNFARNLVRGLPVSASAVYAATVSATATAFFLKLGATEPEAISAAFALAVIPGTMVYRLHPAIRDLRAFAENPNEFMKSSQI